MISSGSYDCFRMLAMALVEIGLAKLLHSSQHNPELWIFCEGGKLFGQLTLHPEVVGIQEGDEASLGGFDAVIESGGGAGVLLKAILHFCKSPGDGGTIVGGTVVRNDQLNWPIVLCQDTLDGCRQVFFCIENRHDYADQRTLIHNPCPQALDLLQIDRSNRMHSSNE